MLNAIEGNPDIEVPGVGDDGDLDDDAVRKQAWKAMGRRLKSCFSDGNVIEIDGFQVRRVDITDAGYRNQVAYVVEKVEKPQTPENPPGDPREKTADPLDPRGDSKHFVSDDQGEVGGGDIYVENPTGVSGVSGDLGDLEGTDDDEDGEEEVII